MNEPVLIVGTREMAKVLGVGRNRLIGWLADPAMGLPASKKLLPGRWVATKDNLTAWANEYFSSEESK